MHGRIFQALSVVGLLAWLLVSPAGAQTCGDPDSDGQTTVADGIQTLRAAALLSSSCVNATCDLDGSGSVNVNDGVNVLRKAAGLSAPNACLGSLECDASCVQAQAGSVVTRIQGALEIGVAALPASAAVIAGTTPDCPDGGFSTGDENGFTDVDCRNGDLVSNGSVVFSDIPSTQDRQASFAGFSVTRISTGETLVSSGTLVVSRQDASVTINGSVARSSNLLGEYDETFTDVVGVESGDQVAMAAGTVLTTVTNGLGSFTSVAIMESHIRGPQLVIVDVTFQDATHQVTIHEVSDIGLCDPCATNADCDAQLACQPCVDNCTGAPKRCSVDFQNFGAQCEDGLF